MKFRTTLLISALVVLSSCRSTVYYQVYKTQSETVKTKQDNSISYEDTQCRIDYNLWTEKGNAGFTFYNKTDEVIHLMLEESFYVLNGVAYDYYQNRIFTNGSNTTTQVTKGGGVTRLGWMSMYASASVVSNSSSSVATIEAKVIAIPPKTAKTISEFDINHTVYRDCDLFLYPSRKQIKDKNFTDTTTPLKFYNTISYKIGNKETSNKINNDFYISQITNYPEEELLKSTTKEFCGQKDYSSVKSFKETAPNWFYLRYTRENDYWKH